VLSVEKHNPGLKETPTSMSNYGNNIPPAFQKIRSGDFEGAQADLTNAAAAKIQHAQMIDEAQRITDEAGPYAKYAMPAAAARIDAEMRQGRFTTPAQVTQAYREALENEIETFRREIRPGYQRDSYNSGNVADQEVSDYVAERRARTEQLKQEGRKISSLGPTR
jgi:hypothetical protein